MRDLKDDRHRDIRISLHETVIGELRIIGVGGREVQSGARKVIVLDVSPNGVKFATGLRFDLRAEWKVSIRFRLEGYELEMIGVIRNEKADEHWREYGVQMDSNPLMRTLIIGALNLRLIRESGGIGRIHRLYGRMVGSRYKDAPFLGRGLEESQ